MNYNINLKLVVSYLFLILILINCSDENNISSPVILDDLYIIDTLEVSITYDDTPGFKYPLMKHYINTVTRLTKKGVVNYYGYKCEQGNVSMFASYEYFNLDMPNYKFRNQMTVWSATMFNPNTVVPYTLQYSCNLENGSNDYIHKATVKVNYSNTGIKPESNSIQLTGPQNYNYSPRFSYKGSYIYYLSANDKRSIFRTDLNGGNLEEIKLFDNQVSNIGVLELTPENELIYVIWKPNTYSKIVTINLDNKQSKEFVVNGFLWGSRPINIPGTKKYLNQLDPNSTKDYSNKVLVADIETQKVDTLLNDTNYQIESYTLNPVDQKLYISVPSGNKHDILIYDYFKNSMSTFLTNVDYQVIRFLPNGRDYGFLKSDQNRNTQIYLNINGQEKQLTTYPGIVTEFDFSPNGDMIVFTARRRGEVQSWLMKL